MQQQKIPRPTTELAGMLDEHLQVLTDMCANFDAGKDYYAKPIAANLRVLLQNKGRGVGLLFQIYPSPAVVEMCDTEKAQVGGDAMLAVPLAGMVASPWPLSGEKMQQRWLPCLNDPAGLLKHRTRVDYWWEDPVALIGEAHFSRERIVLATADQDGGTHVDPKLEPEYFGVTRRDETGIAMFSGTKSGEFDFVENTVVVSADGSGLQITRAIVRQIAHEVLLSLLIDPSAYLKQSHGAGLSGQTYTLALLELRDPMPRRHHWPTVGQSGS